jgi:hypothetical protein
LQHQKIKFKKIEKFHETSLNLFSCILYIKKKLKKIDKMRMRDKLCLYAATLTLTSFSAFCLSRGITSNNYEQPEQTYHSYCELVYNPPSTIQQNEMSYESVSDNNDILSLIQRHEISKPAIINYPIVAVLDTGLNKYDKELLGKVKGEKNFTDSPTADDISEHGNYIARIIIEADNDYSDFYGLECGCRLLNVKVTNSVVISDTNNIVKGIIWATDNGANVINMSLHSHSSQELKDAVYYAWAHGVVLVASAGTSNDHKLDYPADYPNCISVACADTDGKIPKWSIDSHWDVLGPESKSFTSPNIKMSGPSVATAKFSALAATLFKIEVDKNDDGFVNDEIKKEIEQYHKFEPGK